MPRFALIVANALVLAAALFFSRRAEQGVNFPSRPIRLVVPFGAGGGTDTFARIIDKAIRDNDLLPVPLVIINQGGAGGTIGSRRTKDARPDGYTLMILHQAIFTAKISGMANYGMEAFEPVAATGEIATVLAVPKDSRWNSLAELLSEAAEKPDRIRFAANMGALSHFVGLQLEQLQDGAAFRFAQFGGGADRLSAILGDHVDLSGFTVEEFLKFQPKGLRALAVFGQQRHPAIPEVPTAIEQGYDFSDSNTFFWWVPQGTDEDRIAFLADVLERAMQMPFVQERLRSTHFKPVFLRDAALRTHLQQVDQDFSKVVIPRDQVMPDITFLACTCCGLLGLMALLPPLLSRWNSSSDVRQSVVAEEEQRRGHASSSLRPAVIRTIVVLVATAIYVAALSSGGIDFRIATIVFVLVSGCALLRGQFARWPEILLLAQGLGFGLHFVFTQLLVIDLP